MDWSFRDFDLSRMEQVLSVKRFRKKVQLEIRIIGNITSSHVGQRIS